MMIGLKKYFNTYENFTRRIEFTYTQLWKRLCGGKIKLNARYREENEKIMRTPFLKLP